MDEAARTRAWRLVIAVIALVGLVVFGIARGIPPIPMILIAAGLGMMVLRLSPGLLGGHRPRMWTLNDGTYMTGCACGWSGGPRPTQSDAEADLEHHRADPSAAPGGRP